MGEREFLIRDDGLLEDDRSNFKLILKEKLSFDPVEVAAKVQHLSANPYGDWVAHASVLKLLTEFFPNESEYKIMEIGCAGGFWIKTMSNLMEVLAPGKTKAIGMDSMLHTYKPEESNFDGYKVRFVEGKTTDKSVVDTLPDECHYIFIDACHCDVHVCKDAKMFAPKVKKGGVLAFHDSSPRFQRGSEQPKTPECNQEDTRIGVVKGIAAANLVDEFDFLLEEYHTDNFYYGGVTAFRKR